MSLKVERGLGDWDWGVGRGDAWGLEDVLEDFTNKQHIDFCVEFAKYKFRWLSEW